MIGDFVWATAILHCIAQRLMTIDNLPKKHTIIFKIKGLIIESIVNDNNILIFLHYRRVLYLDFYYCILLVVIWIRNIDLPY